MLRVLHLIPTFGRGGSEKIIRAFALGMVTHGYQSILGIGMVRGSIILEDLGIPWIKVPLFPSNAINFYRSYLALTRSIKEYDIDLIHSHHRFPNIISQLVGWRLKVPCVVTVHDFASGKRSISRIGLGKHVQVFSKAVEQHLINHFGLNPGIIHRIPIGISPVSPLSVGEIIKNKKKYGSSAVDPIIGFVGRLVNEKGLDYLIKAFAMVVGQFPTAKLWIIGEGDLRGNLELSTVKLGIRDNVLFLGGQDDVSKFIFCFDIVAVPSLREGFGLAALEGLAHGKPVIATKVGGLVEMIEDAKNGLLVSPKNIIELAEAIILLLKSQDLLRIMGEHALKSVRRRFSVEHMLEGTKELYQASIHN